GVGGSACGIGAGGNVTVTVTGTVNCTETCTLTACLNAGESCAQGNLQAPATASCAVSCDANASITGNATTYVGCRIGIFHGSVEVTAGGGISIGEILNRDHSRNEPFPAGMSCAAAKTALANECDQWVGQNQAAMQQDLQAALQSIKARFVDCVCPGGIKGSV